MSNPDFQIWADNLPHVSGVFLSDPLFMHFIVAENIGLLESEDGMRGEVIVQNELFAMHTTTS